MNICSEKSEKSENSQKFLRKVEKKWSKCRFFLHICKICSTFAGNFEIVNYKSKSSNHK